MADRRHGNLPGKYRHIDGKLHGKLNLLSLSQYKGVTCPNDTQSLTQKTDIRVCQQQESGPVLIPSCVFAVILPLKSWERMGAKSYPGSKEVFYTLAQRY